jgi:hypothetical protein
MVIYPPAGSNNLQRPARQSDTLLLNRPTNIHPVATIYKDPLVDPDTLL